MSSTDVEFGYHLPGFSGNVSPETWRRIARSAEEYGVDCLWMGDHITLQDTLEYEQYQFVSPEWATVDTDCWDVFQVMSYLASITEEVHLGTNICVAPLRHPITLTKNVLTVEALSEGRFEFGAGVGWIASEFDVMGVPFEERGERFDEFLEIYVQAVERGEVSHSGKYYSFDKTGFYPRSPRADGPRLWIGGGSGATFRRVAQFGDGWTIVEETPEELRDGRAQLRKAWEDYDRAGEPQIAANYDTNIDDDYSDVTHRNVKVGSVDDIIDYVQRYVDAGATLYVIQCPAPTRRKEVEQFERFCSEVLPSFR